MAGKKKATKKSDNFWWRHGIDPETPSPAQKKKNLNKILKSITTRKKKKK